MSGRSRTSPWLAWLLLGPTLVVAGALLGGGLPQPEPAVWSEPPPQARHVGIPSLAPIVRAVRSGVVGVRVVRQSGARAQTPGAELSDDRSGVVRGSGFIIHDSGLAVTNHHLVVEHARIAVEIPGHGAVPAELVGDDPVTDIAVLRFEPPPGGVTALVLGDSNHVEQGDWVLAVGNPFEYSETVTVGIVSHVGRHIPEEGLLVSNEYLQFSAPVNPGSSGGPVLDLHGHVVGVTTSAHATGAGISFAVPSKVLKWVLQRMDEAEGRVQRGFLGVRLVSLDPELARALGIDSCAGALIRRVEKGRAADRAGLRAGDVVVSYNGQPVPDAHTLFDWITYSRPGERAVIEVLREGRRIPRLVAWLGEVEYRPPPSLDKPVQPDTAN